MTETRSNGVSSANQSAVMMLTIEALEAWWPPTLTPEWLGRPALAASTMAADSHSTRRAISRSTPWSYVGLGASEAVRSALVGMRVPSFELRPTASGHGGVLTAPDDLLVSEPDIPGYGLRGRDIAALGQ